MIDKEILDALDRAEGMRDELKRGLFKNETIDKNNRYLKDYV